MAFNFAKITKSVMGNTLPAAGGGVASLAVNKFIPASISPKMRGIGKILVSAIIPELMPKMKFLGPASQGFAGHAGAELATEFMPTLAAVKPVAGIGSDGSYTVDEDGMNGTDEETLGSTTEDPLG